MKYVEKMCIFPTPINNPRNSKVGYVYFCKITNYKNDEYYKIGRSGNIKQRIPLLELHHTGINGSVQLLAVGSTNDMRKLELHLHNLFFSKRYSFLYSAGIPKWSFEYFNLDYNDICRVIKEMKERCNCMYQYTSLLVDGYTLPDQRMLPHCIHDLGWWESRELRCRIRSKCCKGDCASYEKCRIDLKYVMCD